MFVARWSVDVKFGHKDQAMDIFRKWQKEVGEKVGWGNGASRILTGSVGAPESRIENEMQVSSLGDLERAFAEMPKHAYHKKFSDELEPHIVSGTNRWEVFRVLDNGKS